MAGPIQTTKKSIRDADQTRKPREEGVQRFVRISCVERQMIGKTMKRPKAAPLKTFERRALQQRNKALHWLFDEACKSHRVQWMCKELYGAPFGSAVLPNGYKIDEAIRILENEFMRLKR
jgi:hypothetical protein